MSITKKEREEREKAIETICRITGKEYEKIDSTRCYGKWANTRDYSLVYTDGSRQGLCNGATHVTESLQNLAESLTWFTENRARIMCKLQEIAKADNMLAREKGFLTYEVENVYIGESWARAWRYVMIKLSNGKYFSVMETGLDCALQSEENFQELGRRQKYFPAGGLEESDVDFIFRGVGFSSKSNIYNGFTPVAGALNISTSGASHYEDKTDKNAFYFEAGDDECRTFIKDGVICNNIGSYKASRDVLSDAVKIGLIPSRECGIWESDLEQMYKEVKYA